MRRKHYVIGGVALLAVGTAGAFALSPSQQQSLFGAAYLPNSMLSLFNSPNNADGSGGPTTEDPVGIYASNTQGFAPSNPLTPHGTTVAMNTAPGGENSPDPNSAPGDTGASTDTQGKSQGSGSAGGTGAHRPGTFAALSNPNSSLNGLTGGRNTGNGDTAASGGDSIVNADNPANDDIGTGDQGTEDDTVASDTITDEGIIPTDGDPDKGEVITAGGSIGDGGTEECIVDPQTCSKRPPTNESETAASGNGDEPPTQVDEPATLSLLLMGGLGVLLARRRAKRRAA